MMQFQNIQTQDPRLMQQQFNQFPNYQQFNRPQLMRNGIIWVQGIEGAKAYQLEPNSNVMLLDSDNEGVFYIKVSDNVGMCNLRIFKYSEVTNEQTNSVVSVDMSDYVTREELNEIISNITQPKKNGGKSNGKQLISTTDAKPIITE